MITRLPTDRAEGLLLKHWDHLRFSPRFIQAALYTAAPRLVELVAEAMAQCPTPKEMLQYLQPHYGIRHPGHPGVNRRAQVEALVPYLDYLSEHDIDTFWFVCNENGWFDLRQKHLDRLVTRPYYAEYLSRDASIAAFDRFVAEKRISSDESSDEGFSRGAVTMDEAMALLSDWLLSRQTMDVLSLVATAIIELGRRRISYFWKETRSNLPMSPLRSSLTPASLSGVERFIEGVQSNLRARSCSAKDAGICFETAWAIRSRSACLIVGNFPTSSMSFATTSLSNSM